MSEGDRKRWRWRRRSFFRPPPHPTRLNGGRKKKGDLLIARGDEGRKKEKGKKKI